MTKSPSDFPAAPSGEQRQVPGTSAPALPSARGAAVHFSPGSPRPGDVPERGDHAAGGRKGMEKQNIEIIEWIWMDRGKPIQKL